jgi:outer membrane protein TolC
MYAEALPRRRLARRRGASPLSVAMALALLAGSRQIAAQPVEPPVAGPAASSAPAAASSSAPAAPLPAGPTAERADPAEPPVAEAPAAHRAFTLRQCLALADHNHPSILSARARVEYMRAQLDEARTAPFSNFTLTAGVGPAPTFRGSQIYTQDREVGLSSSIGMAWRASLEGNVPLWTFGKITNLWRAAEAQIQVGEGEADKVRNGIRLDVRRAYYGLQLARDGLALLGEAGNKLDGALVPIKAKVAEGEGDEIDLLRLQTARAELDARFAEAQRGERVAVAALKFYTGVDRDFDIPQLPLKPPRHELTELEPYLSAARRHRPDLRMARAGLAAREAQADLARSRLLPDVGLSLFGNYSRAPQITDQLNPFVRDDANYLRYGFGVGVRWSLDFLPAAARVRQADAQLEEMRHTMRYAMGGIGVEVEKAWAEATEMRKKVDAYKQASKYARQWMIKVAQGIDVGTFEERDMVDPARAYALQRYAYLSALMDLNMAMANLALATGWDTVAEPAD